MFNEFLTTEGERLLAKSIAGTATITFTKMELGDGDRGTSSKNITSLESKRMTLDIYSVQLSGDNHITITSMLKSENIEAGFYFREKAVYATDGTTEILFMYGTAGSLAEWIENSQISVFERTIRTIIVLSEGDAINVTIQEGVYASGDDMKQTKTEILTAISNIKLDGDWAKYSQAESILSMLDTFVTAYTALRAGKLDNLDALVSSRAPANTALNNATWTNARAAALDNLDAKISSRAAASTALSNAIWTNARAGYLDYLANATYGLSAINDAINSNAKFYKASNTVREIIHSGEVSVTSTKYYMLGYFTARRNGIIKVKCELKNSDTTNTAISEIRMHINTFLNYDVQETPILVNEEWMRMYESNYIGLTNSINTGSLPIISEMCPTYTEFTSYLKVSAGDELCFALYSSNQNYTAYCKSLVLCYDEI